MRYDTTFANVYFSGHKQNKERMENGGRFTILLFSMIIIKANSDRLAENGIILNKLPESLIISTNDYSYTLSAALPQFEQSTSTDEIEKHCIDILETFRRNKVATKYLFNMRNEATRLNSGIDFWENHDDGRRDSGSIENHPDLIHEHSLDPTILTGVLTQFMQHPDGSKVIWNNEPDIEEWEVQNDLPRNAPVEIKGLETNRNHSWYKNTNNQMNHHLVDVTLLLKRLCHLSQNFNNQVQISHNKVLKEYERQVSYLRNVVEVVPDKPENSTIKRSVGGFLGKIFGGALDLVTQQQFRKLQYKLITMRENANISRVNTAEIYKAVSSMQKIMHNNEVQSQRNMLTIISNLQNTTSNIFKSMNEDKVIIMKKLHDARNGNRFIISRLVGVFTVIMENMISANLNNYYLQTFTNKIQQSLEPILAGRIPIGLVNPSILRSGLDHIKNTLALNHVREEYSVITDDLVYFYRNLRAHIFMNKDHLYIEIKIPLISSHNAAASFIYDIYQLIVIPLDIGDGTLVRHTNLPDYVAVDRNRILIIEMSQKELDNKCRKNEQVKLCSDVYPRHMTRDGCIDKLITENFEGLNAACDMEIFAGVRKSFIYIQKHDGEVNLYFQGLSNLQFLCANNSQEALTSICGGICKMEVPCGCKVMNDDIMIYEHVCLAIKEEESNLTITAFRSDMFLRSMEDYFSEEDFEIGDDKMDKIYQGHNNPSLVKLTKELKAELDKSLTKKMLLRPLIKHHMSRPFQPILTSDWITDIIVAVILSVELLSLLMIGALSIKINSLKRMVAITTTSNLINKIQAYQPNSLEETRRANIMEETKRALDGITSLPFLEGYTIGKNDSLLEMEEEDLDYVRQYNRDDNPTMGLSHWDIWSLTVSIVWLALAYYAFRLLKLRLANECTEINLLIFNQVSNIQINILKLYHVKPYTVRLSGMNIIEKLNKPRTNLRRELFIEFGSFRVLTRKGQIIQLPTVFKLGWLDLYRLEKLLKGDVEFLVFVRNGTVVYSTLQERIRKIVPNLSMRQQYNLHWLEPVNSIEPVNTTRKTSLELQNIKLTPTAPEFTSTL